MPMGTALQLLIYGDNLNKQKKYQEAYKIFTFNYEKHPTENYALLGMVMGNYFLDKKTEAIRYADKGKKSSDPNWKGYFTSLANDIASGKEVFK